MKYNVEIYDGKKWNRYTVEPGDRETIIRTYGHLADAGVIARIIDTVGKQVPFDELRGRNAEMRVTDAYQLGWEECWNFLEKTGRLN